MALFTLASLFPFIIVRMLETNWFSNRFRQTVMDPIDFNPLGKGH